MGGGERGSLAHLRVVLLIFLYFVYLIFLVDFWKRVPWVCFGPKWPPMAPLEHPKRVASFMKEAKKDGFLVSEMQLSEEKMPV